MPREFVRVLAAPPGFERGVVCAVWRSLPAELASEDIVATVPANVYACLNLVGAGEVRPDGTPPAAAFPAIFVCGPMTRPLVTRAKAPLRSLSVVLQPPLLREWFGVEPRMLVDTWVAGDDLEALRDGAIAPALMSAIDAPHALGEALGPLVGRRGPADDWSALADALLATGSVAAAAAHTGTGVRQFERRFSRGFGLSPKQWLKVKRFEASLVRMARHGDSLAGVAAETGYADQAHMTREYRDIAANTPGQARGALASQALGYWAFRPAADAVLEVRRTAESSPQVGFVQDPTRSDR